jgi:hypothetical protein
MRDKTCLFGRTVRVRTKSDDHALSRFASVFIAPSQAKKNIRKGAIKDTSEETDVANSGISVA